MAGHTPQWRPGSEILCTTKYEMSHSTQRFKREVFLLKEMTLCDTLGRQIHPEFYVTGPLLSLAFSPGLKLQVWAMGADRRWATGRHGREWIKECGRWQGHHTVYLTVWREYFHYLENENINTTHTNIPELYFPWQPGSHQSLTYSYELSHIICCFSQIFHNPCLACKWL